MTFGEKLQTLRRARGWSQEQLAAQISVSRQAISKWEADAATPDTENVVRLSRLFGVTCDYLLCEEHRQDAPMPPLPAHRASARVPVIAGAGGCAAALGALGLLTLFILSSVFPSFEIISYYGEWERFCLYVTSFLQKHQLAWLFRLCCLLLAAGLSALALESWRRMSTHSKNKT